jgi:hypothetical protein
MPGDDSGAHRRAPLTGQRIPREIPDLSRDAPLAVGCASSLGGGPSQNLARENDLRSGETDGAVQRDLTCIRSAGPTPRDDLVQAKRRRTRIEEEVWSSIFATAKR